MGELVALGAKGNGIETIPFVGLRDVCGFPGLGGVHLEGNETIEGWLKGASPLNNNSSNASRALRDLRHAPTTEPCAEAQDWDASKGEHKTGRSGHRGYLAVAGGVARRSIVLDGNADCQR